MGQMGDGGQALLVKSLPCKQEDLKLNPCQKVQVW